MKNKRWTVILGGAVIALVLAAGACGKPVLEPDEEEPYIREITVDGESEEEGENLEETKRGQYIID